MNPYDEQEVSGFCADASGAYAEAHQPWNSDAGVWVARMQFDAAGQLGYPASRSKHLGELRTALGLVPPFPPAPSRDQVCSVQLTLSGLTISTIQYGTQPWFEIAYQTLTSAEDRASVRAQKKAAGDTHLILEFFTNEQSIYDEPGQPWQKAMTPSGENNPQWFRGLVEEVIRDGLIPIVAFDGDDGQTGHFNALRQLPILVSLLSDLNRYLLYARLWDGVFYGSTPEQIGAFGLAFRNLLPNGYLAIEHNTGHIPVGNGEDDYRLGGLMQPYDVVFSEWGVPLEQDSFWQVAARLIGPAYRRPPDQPSADDPRPPFYLAPGTPRGPYYAISFELVNPGLYAWVRGQCTAAQIQQKQNYVKAAGYRYRC